MKIMKTNRSMISKGLFLLAILIGSISCTRDEFMPAPIGEAIPFRDTTLSVEDYMAADTQHVFFWRAWRRSTVKQKLMELNPEYSFTLFIPSDEAMEAAGKGRDFLVSATQQQLDSLVLYHTSPIQLDLEALKAPPRNIPINTLLTKYVTSFSNEEIKYDFMARVEDGNLLLKNQVVGKESASAVLKHATIFPIDSVLKAPFKSIRQVLVEDGRFSLYLGIRRYNDSLYQALANISSVGLEVPFTHIDAPYEKQQYVSSRRFTKEIDGQEYEYNWNVPCILDILGDAYHYLDNGWYQENSDLIEAKYNPQYNYYRSTLLVPTDEAFQKAGFRNLQDLIDFNKRSLPEGVWRQIGNGGYSNYQGVTHYLPTDSILNNHFWGINGTPIKGEFNEQFGYFDFNSSEPLRDRVIYANELNNVTLSGIPLSSDYSYKNILDFQGSYQDGLTVRVRGSEYEAANVIEKDIETFSGVIHVLDRLLIPAGMKLK